MRIAVLFDGASALGAAPDLNILATIEAAEAALAGDGHEPVRVPVHPDARWIERLRRGKFELALNLCEGIDGVAAHEPAVIGVLELLGIPFTGASSYTTSICLRKPVVNALLHAIGLPVPRFGLVRRGDPLPAVGFPAICKPAAEDASIGVEQRSVVRTRAEMRERLAAMHERWDDILVQRFVDGREVNVGILGDQVLPVSEIDFGAMPRGAWRIVTYTSKWVPGSADDVGSVPVCPASIEPETAQEIVQIARAAWRAVGGEGYGRVDLRIDREGRPWVLEVNANPDLAPDAGLARMARAVGMDYGALLSEVCALALRRARLDHAQLEARWRVAERLSGVGPGESGGAALDLFAAGGGQR